jgi:hypothetical protein
LISAGHGGGRLGLAWSWGRRWGVLALS